MRVACAPQERRSTPEFRGTCATRAAASCPKNCMSYSDRRSRIMKRIPFTLSLIAAAVIGTSPVLAQTTASTATKPLCSSLNNPNAGKLAGKDTGKAKEHSSSPVHQDCIPDSQASTTSSGVTSGTTTQPSISASTGSVTSTPPSVTGSASSSDSSVTGSTASSQNSVTGSTSTFTPNI